jgi:hypothetical protein
VWKAGTNTCEKSEILSYLQANKLACHNFVGTIKKKKNHGLWAGSVAQCWSTCPEFDPQYGKETQTAKQNIPPTNKQINKTP